VQTALIITSVALFLGGIASSYLPFLIAFTKKSSPSSSKSLTTFLSLSNSAAGGVILGASFAGLIPEAQVSFVKFFDLQSGTQDNYPYALVISVCFMVLLFGINRLLAFEQPSLNGATEEDLQVNPYMTMEDSEAVVSKTRHRRAVVFFCALCIHSIFEGLAMGSALDMTILASLMVAILSHKVLEAFAFGMSIEQAHFSQVVSALFIVSYNLVTPVGIALGASVSYAAIDSNSGAVLAQAILMSIAAGSMLYISLLEIIVEEFWLHVNDRTPASEFTKFVALSVGLSVMCILARFS